MAELLPEVCSHENEPGDEYCGTCGKARIRLDCRFRYADGTESTDGSIALRSGGVAELCLAAIGVGSLSATIATDQLQGVVLLDASGHPTRDPVAVKLQGNDPEPTVLRLMRTHDAAEMSGNMQISLDNGTRRQWYEVRGPNEAPLDIASHLRPLREKWYVGTSTVVFPAGGDRQRFRVWNDADAARSFRVTPPRGYRVGIEGEGAAAAPSPDPQEITVAGRGSVELLLEWNRAVDPSLRETQWQVCPDAPPVSLVHLPDVTEETPDYHAIVAIDFGTRNTSIRVVWLQPEIIQRDGEPIDVVGPGDPPAPRFSSQMILSSSGGVREWGTRAEDLVNSRRVQQDDVVIDNLKTCIREQQQRFVSRNPLWTNECLLRLYFQRLLGLLDDYFKSLPHAFRREELSLKYVLCHPVLDMDGTDQVAGDYRDTLRQVLAGLKVPAKDVEIVPEPWAAALGLLVLQEASLQSLPSNTTIAVVDSGGGTTDITTARVVHENGEVNLALGTCFCLRLPQDSTARPALASFGGGYSAGWEDTQFGGNVLTAMLAYVLATSADSVLNSDSDSEEVPTSLWLTPEERKAGVRPRGSQVALTPGECLAISGQLKEKIARGTRAPLPSQADWDGHYLAFDPYGAEVVTPVLRPAVEALSNHLLSRALGVDDIDPQKVDRVFYVGGTNLDIQVRFAIAPAFGPARDEDNSEATQQARMLAVVTGAARYYQRAHARAPLTLTVRSGANGKLTERREPLAQQDQSLLPSGQAFRALDGFSLAAGDYWEAELRASGREFPEPVVLARAHYRNTTMQTQKLSLTVRASSDQGVVANLSGVGLGLELWKVALLDGHG